MLLVLTRGNMIKRACTIHLGPQDLSSRIYNIWQIKEVYKKCYSSGLLISDGKEIESFAPSPLLYSFYFLLFKKCSSDVACCFSVLEKFTCVERI